MGNSLYLHVRVQNIWTVAPLKGIWKTKKSDPIGMFIRAIKKAKTPSVRETITRSLRRAFYSAILTILNFGFHAKNCGSPTAPIEGETQIILMAAVLLLLIATPSPRAPVLLFTLAGYESAM